MGKRWKMVLKGNGFMIIFFVITVLLFIPESAVHGRDICGKRSCVIKDSWSSSSNGNRDRGTRHKNAEEAEQKERESSLSKLKAQNELRDQIIDKGRKEHQRHQESLIKEQENRGESNQKQANALHAANDQGIRLYKNGEYKEAVKYFKIALNYDPGNSDLIYNLRKAQKKVKEEAESYLKHLQDAKQSGIEGSLEAASEEAQKVIDTVGKRRVSAPPPSIVDARGVKESYKIPSGLADHPAWKELEARENHLKEEYEKEEQGIKKLQQRVLNLKAKGLPNTASYLQVQVAKRKQELSNIKADWNQVKFEKRQFTIDFSEQKSSGGFSSEDSSRITGDLTGEGFGNSLGSEDP